SAAFLVAAHAGLDTSTYTFGYVSGWAEQAVEATGKTPHEIVAASGARVVCVAAQLTAALDKALGHGEPPVPAALAERAATGVQAATQLRTSAETATAAQATHFDGASTAARAFPQAAARPPDGPDAPAAGHPFPRARLVAKERNAPSAATP